VVFKSFKKELKATTRKYQTLPQKAVVDTVDDFVLMQHERHLELWRLGQSNVRSDSIAASKST
jgi:hypothetical protein